MYLVPAASAGFSVFPTRSLMLSVRGGCQVAAPAQTNPIQFQSLAFEFRSSHLQHMTGTCVGGWAQKPFFKRKAQTEGARSFQTVGAKSLVFGGGDQAGAFAVGGLAFAA